MCCLFSHFDMIILPDEWGLSGCHLSRRCFSVTTDYKMFQGACLNKQTV